MKTANMTAHSPAKEVFLAFLRLGCTSFGGPVAHLGYFREEFVVRRKWLREEVYADLVALCQFLPGPASSQVGIGIGLSRAGLPGALAAWAGFTLPSAIALILFAFGLGWLGTAGDSGWLQGLKVAAVAVVAQAVLGMAKNLCPDTPRRLLALAAALIALLVAGVQGQLLALILVALIGWRFAGQPSVDGEQHLHIQVGHRTAIGSQLLFFGLLLLLPLIANLSHSHAFELFDSFFRAGSLVFGGGHVVLPLLQAEVVTPGWLSGDLFLAGYGAAQAVPGPLFTFSAYLGAAMQSGFGRWLGGMLCLGAIFLPSFLLIVGILPYWDRLRRNSAVRKLLYGVNAGVVGLLAAAFVTPVISSGIHDLLGLLLAALAYWLLVYRRTAPWLVVLVCGATGSVLL